MGAWGCGGFDNDDAGDWGDQLLDSNDPAVIGGAFGEIVSASGDPDAVVSSRAVAAAEVVAAALGRRCEGFPEELDEWLQETAFRPPERLVKKARAAVKRIQERSELAELWEGDPEWTAAMGDLSKRLAAASTKKKPKKKKAAATSAQRKAIKHLRAQYCNIQRSGGVVNDIISCGGLGDDDLALIAILSDMERLEVSNGTVTDQGVKHLLGLKKLVRLSLANNQLTDEGVRQIAGLTNLTSLNLSGNQITDEGVKCLAGLKNLSSLYLDETQITDEAVAHLRGLPIWSLHLARNDISDDSLKHIGGFANLGILGLGGTQVTDRGLRFLEGLQRLEHLFVPGTKVTKEGIEQLAKSCPLLTGLCRPRRP